MNSGTLALDPGGFHGPPTVKPLGLWGDPGGFTVGGPTTPTVSRSGDRGRPFPRLPQPWFKMRSPGTPNHSLGTTRTCYLFLSFSFSFPFPLLFLYFYFSCTFPLLVPFLFLVFLLSHQFDTDTRCAIGRTGRLADAKVGCGGVRCGGVGCGGVAWRGVAWRGGGVGCPGAHRGRWRDRNRTAFLPSGRADNLCPGLAALRSLLTGGSPPSGRHRHTLYDRSYWTAGRRQGRVRWGAVGCPIIAAVGCGAVGWRSVAWRGVGPPCFKRMAASKLLEA